MPHDYTGINTAHFPLLLLLRFVQSPAQKHSLRSHVSISHSQHSKVSKSGHLSEDNEMLQGIPYRDVVSWNMLIARYTAQNGLSGRAFECFNRMQSAEGISPNPITFVCILKACAGSGMINVCKRMHVWVIWSGFLPKHIVLGTALVDMYVKCSMMDDADEVFHRLTERNVVTWSALIGGYAWHGLGDIALKYFRLMKDEGNTPNVVTFTCALKACGSIGSLKLGEDIHAEVKDQGLLESDIMLGNTLVDMYVKCRELGKAEDVFVELPWRNVYSWSILITGYVDRGLSNAALKCFRQMRSEGIFPNAVTFSCVLKACGTIGLVRIGEEIHAEVNQHAFMKVDTIVGTALVDMYAKCGVLEKAHEVLKGIPERDAVCWSALIAGYTQHGRTNEALECFLKMRGEGIAPNAVTFSCILKACGNGGLLEMGENIHSELKQKGLLEKDLMLGTALMDMYAQCGMLEKAQEIFAKLPVQNRVAWCILITGYAQHGLGYAALTCFWQMRHVCIDYDSVAFICGLKACGSIGCLEIGEEIHAEIKELGFLEKEGDVGNALLEMYVKCGALEKAQEIFQTLSERNAVLWNILMSRYAQQGLSVAVIRNFRQMLNESVFADVVTYICVLKSCGSEGSVLRIKAIHTVVKEQGLLLQKDLMLGNTLVDMYAKCGMVEKAAEVFEELQTRDTVSWNVLMAGYAQMGQAKRAFELFNKMRGENIMPNLASFIILLYGCSHAGLMEEGHVVFHAVCAMYQPCSVEFYTCMIDLLGRAGDFDNARFVFDKMPFADYHPLLSTLLGACRTWVNVELGRSVFEEIIQLDKMCAAAYICMGNAYEAAGMHTEACRVQTRRVKNKAC